MQGIAMFRVHIVQYIVLDVDFATKIYRHERNWVSSIPVGMEKKLLYLK